MPRALRSVPRAARTSDRRAPRKPASPNLNPSRRAGRSFSPNARQSAPSNVCPPSSQRLPPDLRDSSTYLLQARSARLSALIAAPAPAPVLPQLCRCGQRRRHFSSSASMQSLILLCSPYPTQLPSPLGASHSPSCPYSTDALGQSHTVSPSLPLSLQPHCCPPPPARAGLALLRRPAPASPAAAGPSRRRPGPPPQARTGPRRPSSLPSPGHVQRAHAHSCQRTRTSELTMYCFGLQ